MSSLSPEINSRPKQGIPIIGFFPGSRVSVLKKHLPIIEKTAELIRKETNCNFVIFGSKNAQKEYSLSSMPVTYDAPLEERRKLSLAVGVSGTVSLENALLGIPMVVFYKLSFLNYLLAKSIINIPYITMANILAGRFVVPELIQKDATPEKIAKEALIFLKSPELTDTIRKELLSFRKMLGEPGVSKRAAENIVKG